MRTMQQADGLCFAYSPPLRRRLPGDFRPPLGRHLLRPRPAALPPEGGGVRVFSLGLGRRQLVLDLARGDPHDVDGVADYVGETLLATWSLRHRRSFVASAWRQACMKGQPNARWRSGSTTVAPCDATSLFASQQTVTICQSPASMSERSQGR